MADPHRNDNERNGGSQGNVRPELLAPAGDLDTLRVAVRNGADAVYFGARAFNARARAANFDDRQLMEAVDFLHLHRARAYLTLNTLISDQEADEALRLAEAGYRIGIDALIVQDIGLTCAIHERMPDLRLFASTQMSIGNERGIQAARDLGLTRVILPRERTATEVRRLTAFAADIGMETEVFVHGALCVSFSGQCLMSALQGGRSANRGACAQPCRMMYALERDGVEAGGSLPRLSLRDQSLFDQIPSLIASGVASLKIEGRLRSPAYVGTVVGVYRRALDGEFLPGDADRLLQAFNRGGAFTDAYWADRRSPAMHAGAWPGSHGVPLGEVSAVDPSRGRLDIDIGETRGEQPGRGDVLAIRREAREVASAPVGQFDRFVSGLLSVKGFHPDVLRSLRVGDQVYRMTDTAQERVTDAADVRKTDVQMHLETAGSGIARLVVSAQSVDGREIVAEAERETGLLAPLPAQRVIAQLSKTGGTPFRVVRVAVDEPVPSLGVASVNAMRREALETLSIRIGASGHREDVPVGHAPWFVKDPDGVLDPRDVLDPPEGRPSLPIVAHFWAWPADDRPACGADVYLLPARDLTDGGEPGRGAARLRLLKEAEPSARIFAVLPPGAPCGPEMETLLTELDGLRAEGLAGISSHSVDVHALPAIFVRSLEPGGNVLNARSFACHADKGLERICVSHETGGEDVLSVLEAASAQSRAEITLYGRVGAMFTQVCPVAGNACQDPANGICRGASFALRDDRGRQFPVVCHPGSCTADILSSAPIERFDLLEQLIRRCLSGGTPALGSTAWRFSFFDEPQEQRREWIGRLRRVLESAMAGKTRDADLQELRKQVKNEKDTLQ